MSEPKQAFGALDAQEAHPKGCDLNAQPPAIATAVTLVEALIAAGVRYVVHCPGSRCAPFAYALDYAERQGWLQVDVHIDERGAAFAALGAAIASGRPTAVITTSGTAVANLHPALLEAAHSRVPLLAVTADRPSTLIGTGANQTTYQTGIFGPQIPTVTVPEAVRLTFAQAQLAVRRALGAAITPEASAISAPSAGATPSEDATASPALHLQATGPGHLNVHFADPLYPAAALTFSEPQPDPLFAYSPTPARTVRAHGLSSATPAPELTAALSAQLSTKTVVVAGDRATRDFPDLVAVCEQAAWPLLAEPSSGARYGANAINAYRENPLLEDVRDVILVGHPTLSRPITRLLARARVHLVSSRFGIIDTALNLAQLLSPAQVRAWAAASENDTEGAAARTAWLASWQEHAHTAARAFTGANTRNLCAGIIWEQQQESSAPPLVLGASATIRAFDLVAAPGRSVGPVFANRGLAGIDGTIATAFGIARASGVSARAVIGDLTFLHDVASLALPQAVASSSDYAQAYLQLIVMNDRAGGIFNGLEHASAASPELFERYFLTRRDVNIAAVAAAYGWEYTPIASAAELDYLVRQPIRCNQVVEIFLDA